MNEFRNAVVLITGGSGGIGKAAAAAFLSEGASVYINGTSAERLDAAVRELASVGEGKANGAHPVRGDVSLPAECERIVSGVAESAGKLDILVNAAGVWSEGPSDTVSEDEWDRVIDINLKGTFFMCRHAIPCLEKTGGSIVNVSSDAGLVGNREAAVYCASKGGVTLLTRSLAIELAERGIRVNAVCPGEVDTPMLSMAIEKYGGGDRDGYIKELLSRNPQGTRSRLITPEEVAFCILFLASPRVRAVTGSALSIDFGITAGY